MNWDDRERQMDQPIYCEQEQIVGNTTVYCLFEQGHECECIFADPKVIELMAEKNDQVNPI